MGGASVKKGGVIDYVLWKKVKQEVTIQPVLAIYNHLGNHYAGNIRNVSFSVFHLNEQFFFYQYIYLFFTSCNIFLFYNFNNHNIIILSIRLYCSKI